MVYDSNNYRGFNLLSRNQRPKEKSINIVRFRTMVYDSNNYRGFNLLSRNQRRREIDKHCTHRT